MRVAVSPGAVAVTPGLPAVLTVAVTNTGDVINGYRVKVLGVHRAWVELSEERLSLFPDATGVSVLTLTLPAALLAGRRRLSVHVSDERGDGPSEVVDVDLNVPEVRTVDARLEPGTVTAGSRAAFTMVLRNTGNVLVAGDVTGADDEERVRFRCAPPRVALGPGEHEVVEVGLRARRRVVGALAVRQVQVALVPPGRPAAEAYAVARGTFVQKPLVSRGALSLAGLLAAVTVFALVITHALGGVVGRSAADRDLALRVALARAEATGAGTATVTGAVRQLGAGGPLSGVGVELLPASGSGVVRSAATARDGTYALGLVPAGRYKVRFRGAGFAELWYPAARGDADAGTVEVAAGAARALDDVLLGGRPVTIAGTVSGGEPAGAHVTLRVAAAGRRPAAVVRTVRAGPDGAFALDAVPSPAAYEVAVAKPGYAARAVTVHVAPGQDRTGLHVPLVKADGAVSGAVTDADGRPVAGASVSARYGTGAVAATTLTDPGGAFRLRGLPTPQEIVLAVAADGYATQSLALTLRAGQRLPGVTVVLPRGAATLSGVVSVLGDDGSVAPAPGVSVVVTDGVLTLPAVTAGEDEPGAWTVTGLPMPGTYTVTFARDDLTTQTRAVSLDAHGRVAGDGVSGVTLRPSGADVLGSVVYECPPDDPGGRTTPAGEVTVTLASDTATFTVTTASAPAELVGEWRVDDVPPGTYTVTAVADGSPPVSRVVEVTLGRQEPIELVLAHPRRGGDG
ncbi:MAG TPA: carboxypeptidase-like regulatory domain-containing protein [Frankiaceae bacterium]|nr:carboxypeptidase-like regulatory domain-containing protein [Frankiaceae bacterium]